MEYKRLLNLAKLLEKKSFFLFGPRSVGKTTLIKQQFSGAKVYDLLDADVFGTLLRSSKLIEEEFFKSKNRLIVIDEIQKLPKLLDEVHRLIEKHSLRFLLTGSSARKLRRGGANLLGGRAWQASLMPLVTKEIPDFDLLQYLNRGGLPHIYPTENYREELKEYVGLYLREEVQAEALTRNMEAFVRFLDTIALTNGKELNFQNLANDSGVPPRTIENYLSILEDTLLGFKLAPFVKTKKRKAITRSKFFLFDVGVTNSLCHRGEVLAKSALFGDCFEHFLICEIRAYLSYARSEAILSYWRSTSQFEVDCVIGDRVAIECKATHLAHDTHLKGLRALKDEKIFKKYYLVSLDSTTRRTEDGIEIWPWKDFLAALWEGEVV